MGVAGQLSKRRLDCGILVVLRHERRRLRLRAICRRSDLKADCDAGGLPLAETPPESLSLKVVPLEGGQFKPRYEQHLLPLSLRIDYPIVALDSLPSAPRERRGWELPLSIPGSASPAAQTSGEGIVYMRPDRFCNGIGTHATLPKAVQPAVRVTALQPAIQ